MRLVLCSLALAATLSSLVGSPPARADGKGAAPPACNAKVAAKGKPIYERDETPLGKPTATAPVRNQTEVVWADGHYQRTTTRTLAGAAPRTDVEEGCLDAARLGAVVHALGAATWGTSKPRFKCQVASIAHVVYRSPANGKQVAHDEPCAKELLDVPTGQLAACVEAVIDPTVPDDVVLRSCPPVK